MSDPSPARARHAKQWAYGVAVLSSALALLITLLLDDPAVEPNTSLFFIAAVVISSWYGGLGPGLLAVFLTALAHTYYFLPPTHSLAITNSVAAVRLTEFVVVSLLVIAVNTARRSALRRAEAARAEAEAATRAKDEFLAAVSHELRTPATSILGWTTLLRAGQLDQTMATRGLETVERNIKLQVKLIEDLLDVSRITAGNLRLQIREMDLTPVIQAALETVRPAAEAKAIHLRTKLDASAVMISGDPERLQQVVWNLLSNAIKFTPAEGRVEVRLERAGSQAQLTISDTGRGITPDFLPHIFERYRQADTALARTPGGLGLGLAIVRHLVELHGGTVEAESRGEGHGAAFIVKLPLLPRPAHTIGFKKKNVPQPV